MTTRELRQSDEHRTFRRHRGTDGSGQGRRHADLDLVDNADPRLRIAGANCPPATNTLSYMPAYMPTTSPAAHSPGIASRLRKSINARSSPSSVIRCTGILVPGVTTSGPSRKSSATVLSVQTISPSASASE
jgi:hypothetical protein